MANAALDNVKTRSLEACKLTKDYIDKINSNTNQTKVQIPKIPQMTNTLNDLQNVLTSYNIKV